MLRGYGFACLFVLIGFVVVNYYRPEQGGFVANLTPTGRWRFCAGVLLGVFAQW